MLSYGAVNSQVSTWYAVDLDRGEATRMLARLDRSMGKHGVLERVTGRLSAAQSSALSQLTARIWASSNPLPTQMATDVVWDLWLLDGGDVRREFGPGRPAGMAQDLARTMQEVVGL
ncbi:hypothetical protein G4G28_16635 [Massilia sp. Dwa41.01b]|uniref:hypothetical protein n=1 Tax=unclassified Massilia TaxID=2609279 RepID=UPI0016019C3E|nr:MULTISPECIES: hypothetical protein [unclassified Massilia]QNA89692.1 hypothetical protein G4G28_16635 [Massilia sp. Dwa41.01b]QNB00587.1 hypothetical protein G4G31_20220 [Massilia sp. Se16.2.3]